MDIQKIIELFLYSLPAIITGGVAYLFFKKHTDNEEGRRRYLVQKDLKANALPLRLQAYERMALFLERINPNHLLLRVTPLNDDKNQYQQLIVANIEQEFEHNLAQQIYISEECWTVIKSAKNTTISIIRNAEAKEDTKNANHLREVILTSLLQKAAPSDTGMAFIKNELNTVFG